MAQPAGPLDQTRTLELDAVARLLDEVFAEAPLGLLLVDGQLRVMGGNSLGLELLAARRGDVLPDRMLVAVGEAGSRDWSAAMGRALAGAGVQRYESERFESPDQGVRTLDIALAGVGGSKAEASARGVLVIVQDVTAKAELERRLATAESLAAVGRLAARVAHELNNPLDGALRYLNLATRKLSSVGTGGAEAAGAIANYLDQARQGLLRMARIIGDLLEFSRSGPQLREAGNINATVEEAIHALRMSADEAGITVAAAFHDDAAMPALEGTRLFQVCCNLIRNAIDAMPAGGMLTITTGLVGADVVIRFEDTGVGIPAEAGKLFEPFYTTKAPGKGTGLGLALCKEYVEQLGGSITAERGKEKGSVFTLRIPVSSCKETRGGQAAPEVAPGG
jgi:signal transduction histidine kinase